MTDTDHPELVEFEGKTLGDTLTNLLAEVKRLRKKIALAHNWVCIRYGEDGIDEFEKHIEGMNHDN